MPSLRDLRRRIKGVQNMRKITKAMELVAAARMRRAQERVLAARPYSDEIASIMTELMRRSPQYEHPFLKVREVEKRLIILVTADRGLCRRAEQQQHAPRVERRREDAACRSRTSPSDAGAATCSAACIATSSPTRACSAIDPPWAMCCRRRASRWSSTSAGEVQQIDIVYARFISVGRQQTALQRVIPVVAAGGCQGGQRRLRVRARSRRTCSTRCCRATSRRRSTARCWRTRHPSRRRAWWRCATRPTTQAISSRT